MNPPHSDLRYIAVRTDDREAFMVYDRAKGKSVSGRYDKSGNALRQADALNGEWWREHLEAVSPSRYPRLKDSQSSD